MRSGRGQGGGRGGTGRGGEGRGTGLGPPQMPPPPGGSRRRSLDGMQMDRVSSLIAFVKSGVAGPRAGGAAARTGQWPGQAVPVAHLVMSFATYIPAEIFPGADRRHRRRGGRQGGPFCPGGAVGWSPPTRGASVASADGAAREQVHPSAVLAGQAARHRRGQQRGRDGPALIRQGGSSKNIWVYPPDAVLVSVPPSPRSANISCLCSYR